MNISFHHVFSVHNFGGIATNSIAHFAALLDFVVPPINLEVASSSRLARNAEKRTLEPVQLRFLGLLETPQMVSVNKKELLQEQGAYNLMDALLLKFFLKSIFCLF